MGGKEKFASDTSARSFTEWIKALIFLLIGLTVAHFGVALFLLSELGTDTFTVFIQGLSRVSGLTVGTVHVIVLCILMAVMLMCTKGYVKPGTVVCAFCGGPIIDFFTWLFQAYINGTSALGVRAAAMLAINSNAGTGPNDLVAVILSDKIEKFQFRWIRIGCDLFFVVLGFLLGGTVGAGTIAAVVLTGPLVQFWLPKTKKLAHMALRENLPEK